MLRLEWWKPVAFAARGWIQELFFFWQNLFLAFEDNHMVRLFGFCHFTHLLCWSCDSKTRLRTNPTRHFCTKVMEAADSHFWWKFQIFSWTCASTRLWVLQSRSDKFLITCHIRKARLFGSEGKRDSLTGRCWATPAGPRPGEVAPLLRNDPPLAECWASRGQSQARVQNTTFHNLILGIAKLCKMIMIIQ